MLKKCFSAVVLHLFHYIDPGFGLMKVKSLLLATAVLYFLFVNRNLLSFLVFFWIVVEHCSVKVAPETGSL